MATLSRFQNYLFPAREINEDIKSIDFCFNGQLLFVVVVVIVVVVVNIVVVIVAECHHLFSGPV